MLMYQSLKKWIYNNYNGDQIDNVIVDKLELSDQKLIKKFLLIDTNINPEENEEANIERKKLVFMDIVFTDKLKTGSRLFSKYEDVIINIHNPRYYYQLDGLKIII